MQAHINFNKSVYNTLYYHERKLRIGTAECIGAGNFIKELPELDLADKQYQIQRLTRLNEAVTNRVLHIALTFHPSERIANRQMVDLAEEYLQKMKLVHQPYLVYRHNDTLHPHMHLVLPGVYKDATRVHLTPADYHESTNITRELTLRHRLVLSLTAEERAQRPRQAMKVKYGEMALRPAINNVLNKVLPLYKYPDMEVLNAVLHMYNLQVYRGREDSEMYLNRGLALRVLDESGKPMFGQFKASHFDNSPTLGKLEKNMELNRTDELRQQHRQRVTTLLLWHSTRKNMDMPTLEKTLRQEQISMVWMKEKSNAPEKLFYVDHATRAVFDGQELGYDANTLRQRLAPVQVQEQKQELKQQHRHRLKHFL